MRIAILGRTSLLFNSMKLLASCGHEIVVIGVCKAAPEYDVTEKDFEQYADEHSIKFFCNANLENADVLGLLEEVGADIAVSVNWVNIISEKVIGKFKYGILNAHAGDLPRYRGNACPNWAILLGEKSIGVSVHFMAPGELDSGDVLLKKYYDVNRQTRIGEIYQWLNTVIPGMFLEAVSGLENGTIVSSVQSKNKNAWLRVYPRKPSDGLIDWNKSALEIERLVNASSEPFAGAYTWYKMNKLIIWRAFSKTWDCPSVAVPGQVLRKDRVTGQVDIACGEGVLCLVEISLEGFEGKKSPAEVITSMRDRVGMNVEDEIYRLYRKMMS